MGFYYTEEFAKQLWILDDPWVEDPDPEETKRRIKKWFQKIGGEAMAEIPGGEPTGGYDGGGEKKEMSSGDKIWSLVSIPATLHGGILAHLRCDGEPRAVVNLEDEEELKWLKARIDGVQPSRDVELRR